MVLDLLVDAVILIAGSIFISKNRHELGNIKKDVEKFRDDIQAKEEQKYQENQKQGEFTS